MPREVTHWLVVERALQQVAERSASESMLLTAARRYPAAVRLGALAHDAPYYYRLGGSSFEPVAERLHGRHGEDTFEPIRSLFWAAKEQVAQKKEVDPQALYAFTFGMLTHAVTDIHFHPLVFYFSGNYYDTDPVARLRARGRHRLLETYIDTWFLGTQSLPFSRRIAEHLREAQPTMPAILQLLESVLPGTQPGCWSSSFQYISWLQGRFISAPWGAMFRVATTIAPSLYPLDALFDFGRRKPAALFSAPLAYRNPISGEAVTASVEELLTTASTVCANYLIELDSWILGHAPQPLAGRRGASLNFGVENATPEQSRTYTDQPLPLAGWGPS